jgi:hypothetical protein
MERWQSLMIGFVFQFISILITPNVALANIINERDKQHLLQNHSLLITNIASQSSIQPEFQLAFHESLGFFHNIHEHNWRIKKRIAANRKHIVIRHNCERVYYQHNWNPDFSCSETDSMVPMGSGGHWVCDAWRLNKPGCVIYSIASTSAGFGFRFEAALKRQLPLCDIHIFVNKTSATTNTTTTTQRTIQETLTFHELGIRGTDLQRYSPKGRRRKDHLSTLPDMVRMLGHSKIDLMLLDCKGCERDIFLDIGLIDFRQIILKVQGAGEILKTKKERVMNVITAMLDYLHHNLSYVIFHKEPDLLEEARNVEFSLLKLHSDFLRSEG